MPTIVGLFENEDAARAALQSIHHENLKNIGVQLVTKNEKHQLDPLKKSLKAGDVEYYEGRLDHGASLLVVETDGDHVGRITELLRQHGMKDVEGGARVEHKIEHKVPIAAQIHELKEGEYILPVVQESLEIGKREVERGRVRVHSKVFEDAVEKEIGLRGETIHINRRVVDRPVTEADRELFKELLIEVIERGEDAVVTKHVKIVGEVVLTKEVAEKKHTIRDTVRRVDVEVEEIRGDRVLETHLANFHGYYDRDLAWTHRPFDEFVPAFQFGLALARDERFRSKNWNEIDQEAQELE